MIYCLTYFGTWVVMLLDREICIIIILMVNAQSDHWY